MANKGLRLACAVLGAVALAACGPAQTRAPLGHPQAAQATSRPRPASSLAHPTQPTAPVRRPAKPAAVAAGLPSDVPMPNRTLTPGAIQSTDTAAICTPGWAAAHRDVSEATKDEVAAEYGLASRAGYEIDHLIPLELGGANSVANLWPEPYASPFGAIQKDGLEDWLHQQVCAGDLPLLTAQREIATDWYRTWVAAGRPMPSWFGYSNSPGGASAGTGGDSQGGTAPPAAAGSAGSGSGSGSGSAGWCTATAAPANDGYAGDYDVYVRSNQPDQKATASDGGDSWSQQTDSSGSATIHLWHTSAGETVDVLVGPASCTATASS